MIKNILSLIFAALLLSSCTGAMPRVPYGEYIKTHPKETRQVSMPAQKEKVSSRSQITHLPGGGVRYNSGTGVGVEVTEVNDPEVEITTITPFFGDKSPAYEQGRRDAEYEIRQMKESSEIDFAIEKGRKDGEQGVYSPGGINFKFLREYQEAFDDAQAGSSLQEDDQRKDLEYQQGWDDAFEKAGISNR